MFINYEPDEALDRLTRDAAIMFNVPIAMINFVTPAHVTFKSCVGLEQGDHIERNGAFCSQAVEQDSPLVIPDARNHEVFMTSPLVTGPLQIRSYAGKSIITLDGLRVGTFCLLDTKLHNFTKNEIKLLSMFTASAEEHLQSLLCTSRSSLSSLIADDVASQASA